MIFGVEVLLVGAHFRLFSSDVALYIPLRFLLNLHVTELVQVKVNLQWDMFFFNEVPS